MSAPSLSFAALYERVDGIIKNADRTPEERQRRWMKVAIAGVAIALTAQMLPKSVGPWVSVFGILLECVAFLMWVGLNLLTEWPRIRKDHKVFADDLDTDFAASRDVVRWIAGFPIGEIEQRLRYVRDRRAALNQRVGLATGGVERLGVLPLLAVLYLQLKDWRWGDWSALGSINLVGGLLLWALLLIYAGSWWLLRLRSRVELYESLLAEAAASKDAS